MKANYRVTWCSHHGPHIYFGSYHVAVVCSKRWSKLSFARLRSTPLDPSPYHFWYLSIGPVMLTNSKG